MKVGFASRDWSFPPGVVDPDRHVGTVWAGGSNWYRCRLPARWLERRGWATVVGWLVAGPRVPTLGVRTWDGEIHWDCDVVVLQRWMHRNVARLTARARAAGQVVLNDVDDWWWGLSRHNRAWRLTHPEHDPDENRETYRSVLRESDAVVVSTPFLRDRLAWCRRVVLCRNFDDPTDWPLGRVHSGKPVIGWVGATPWRSGDLEVLQGVLGPFVERHNLFCHHSGHVPGQPGFAELAGVPASRVTTSPMVPVERVPGLFDPIDVGLVPLTEVPFNRAKSAIKGIQYALSGIPFVASPLPEYRWLAAHGVGRLAGTPREWVAHLTELLDPEVREVEARANLEAVLAVVAVGAEPWERLILSLVGPTDRSARPLPSGV